MRQKRRPGVRQKAACRFQREQASAAREQFARDLASAKALQQGDAWALRREDAQVCQKFAGAQQVLVRQECCQELRQSAQAVQQVSALQVAARLELRLGEEPRAQLSPAPARELQAQPVDARLVRPEVWLRAPERADAELGSRSAQQDAALRARRERRAELPEPLQMVAVLPEQAARRLDACAQLWRRPLLLPFLFWQQLRRQLPLRLGR